MAESDSRNYIRHPSEIPIEVSSSVQGLPSRESLQNLSVGGLCFVNGNPLNKGEMIHIAIPIVKPPFSTQGIVRWCKQAKDLFLVGVVFESDDQAYSLRLVEQVCYIEHYRQQQRDERGRELTSEEAALEWISLYAGKFREEYY